MGKAEIKEDEERLELKNSVERLIAELKSANSTLQWQAASFCSEIKADLPRCKNFVDFLRRENMWDQIVEALIAILRDDKDMGSQEEAIIALESMRDLRAVEPLKALLNHPHLLVRLHVKKALEEITGENFGYDPKEMDEALETLEEIAFIQAILS